MASRDFNRDNFVGFDVSTFNSEAMLTDVMEVGPKKKNSQKLIILGYLYFMGRNFMNNIYDFLVQLSSHLLQVRYEIMTKLTTISCVSLNL